MINKIYEKIKRIFKPAEPSIYIEVYKLNNDCESYELVYMNDIPIYEKSTNSYRAEIMDFISNKYKDGTYICIYCKNANTSSIRICKVDKDRGTIVHSYI